MSGTRQRIFVVLAATVFAAVAGAQTQVARAPYLPEPISDAGWIREVAQQQGMLTNQPCQACFIGDSLTKFWTSTGETDWKAHFAPLKSANLGLAADRTEHVLNRIHRLDFRRAKPRLIVLLMGTNNLGKESPDKPADVARAVQMAAAELRRKMPQAGVLVLTIPPSGDEPNSPLRQRIKETNVLLSQATWPQGTRLLPIYDEMVDKEDRWHEGFTLDGTHFSAAGYARLAELLAPVVQQMLPPKGTP